MKYIVTVEEECESKEEVMQRQYHYNKTLKESRDYLIGVVKRKDAALATVYRDNISLQEEIARLRQTAEIDRS